MSILIMSLKAPYNQVLTDQQLSHGREKHMNKSTINAFLAYTDAVVPTREPKIPSISIPIP